MDPRANDTTDDTKSDRRGVRVDLGLAYGLIAGAAVGSLLLALTGDVLWISIGPGLGLLVGLVTVGLWSRGKDGGEPDA